MSAHDLNKKAIEEGTKGGPGQKNQNAQAGLGAERHQGGGVLSEEQQRAQNPGQTGTPGGKGKQDGPQNQKR